MARLALVMLFMCYLNIAYASSNFATIVSLDYRAAAQLDNTDITLSRFSANTQTRFNLNRQWSAQLDTRVEIADDDTGLGASNGYASLNSPLIDDDNTRVEIDRAYVQWRKQAHSLTLGKQVTPWGVLDGIQITDRFDPVRRRDFVFTDNRPDRLARWGARWRNKLGDLSIDTSFAIDGTVSQQADIGALFFNTSSRFTGGLDISNTAVAISTQTRSHALKQSTLGVRFSYPVGQGDLSLLSFRGPDTDPILSLQNRLPTKPIAVELAFKRRTLYGASYDVTLGETVLRAEMAYIPDQTVNILSNTPLQTTEVQRLLVGFGLDWNAPKQWFLNMQLAIDYIDSDAFTLLRPSTDTVVTLRVQRTFFNSRLLFKGELLGTLNQGDGVIRPELAFEYTDKLTLRAGVDRLFGDENGQFGQFKQQSRIWFAATYTF